MKLCLFPSWQCLAVCCFASYAAQAQSGGDADLGDFANVPRGDSTVVLNVPATPYPIGATVRYFSPTGDNASGNGLTPATAWRTLTQGLANDVAKIPTGATLVFATGGYPVDNVRLNRALTLQPAAGAQAWLMGSEELPANRWEPVPGTPNLWRTVAAYPWTVRFTNELQNAPQTIIGTCPDGTNSSDHVACPPTDDDRRAGYRDQVFVDGKPLKQALRLADLVPGQRAFFVDEAGSRLYIGRNPNGHRVEASVFNTALTLNTGPAPGQRLVVRGLGFRNYADETVVSNSGNFLLENCTVAWSATEGANLLADMDDVAVRGNTFAYNGRLGLRIGTGASATQQHTNLVVENNVFSYNNHEGFAQYWSAGGMKMIHFDDVMIRSNLFDNNFGTGLWLDLDVERVQVLGNISRNNQAIGLFFEVSRGGFLAGNVAYGNGAGVKISGSSGVAVCNNTLVNNKVNLDVSDYGRLNDESNPVIRAAQLARGINFETYEVAVRNNVLGNGDRTNLLVTQTLSNPEQGRMIEPGALNYNLYLRWSPQTAPSTTSGGRYYMVHFNNLGPVPKTGPALKYATLADFRAGGTPSNAVFEANGTEVSNRTDGQLFANPAAQDFRLKNCPTSWTIPAADPIAGNLLVAQGTGGDADFAFTPAQYRAALGLAPGAQLRVGGLQQTVGCAGPLAATETGSTTRLQVYPNPVQSTLHLLVPPALAGPAALTLHNSLGQVVLQSSRSEGARGEWTVDVGQLAPGLYWATVQLLESKQRASICIEVK